MNIYVYTNTYIHVITIDGKRNHEFEEEMGWGIQEGLEGGKGREKYCN